MVRRGIGVLFCVCCLTGSVVGQNIVNVAIGKTYNQSSRWDTQGPSSNAANGNTEGTFNATNCIHTQVGPNHWWEVDLGRTYPVYDITVWGRTEFIRRVSPSTITVDNQPCVSVTSVPTSRNKSMTCSSVMYGQEVRLTYTGAETLNLCEFQIFVPSGVSQCPAGHHGAQCGQNCSDNCGGGPGNNFCYQDTGVCYDGCTGNFAGDMCTECAKRYYKKDEGCQECSSDCKDKQCDSDTGTCNGCDDGNYGDQCKQQCSTLNGRCTRCLQNGQQCTACSGHFLPSGSACTGCAQGYHKQGGVCQSCSSGCKNSQCDSTTGECNACPDGYYGNLCQTPCSPGCASCDQTSGNCTVCRDNSHLVSPGCTECKDGYYKQAAPPCIQCPGTCDNNTPCDKTTGHCDECPPGRKGDTCDQACSGGQYGPSRCSLPCGQCQNGTQCDPVTGHCPLCEPGFYPPLCSKQKPANQNSSLIIPVVSSVIVAGVIIAIAVVGSVCWYRRSRRGPAAKRDTRSTVNEPENALGDNGTESLGRQPPSSPSPQEDAAYYEISDTAKTHEMQEVENNYDALHPYSNDDADRQPYSQIKSHPSDVTKPSANAAYVNTAFHNIRGTNNM